MRGSGWNNGLNLLYFYLLKNPKRMDNNHPFLALMGKSFFVFLGLY